MHFNDAHMHFWDRELMPYPWLHEVPSIWHRHTTGNLYEEVSGGTRDGEHLPQKIVFVEAGAPWLEEIKFVEALAASEPRIGAIVTKMTINAGPQTSADIAEAKKHPLVRGARHHFEHEKDLDYCARPAFIAGVKQLAPAGLSFDICCKHPHLPAVIELVKNCSEVNFILNHACKPAIRAKILDPWREHMRLLAKLPNIVCKYSGLVTEADHQSWTKQHLKPYVMHIRETFGPSRMLFGGDWPVAKLASGYVRWLETAQDFVSDLSAAERNMIFMTNAERVYRI